MRTKIWLLGAGAAATLIAGGSGIALATSAASSGSAGSPATAQVADGPTGAPGDRDAFFSAERVARLGSALGISAEDATRIGGELRDLAAKGGGSVSPGDPAFVAIAESVGKTAHELATALDTLKKMG